MTQNGNGSSKLSDTQQTVVKMIGEGKDASQIAKKLKITRNGVYQHIRRLRDQGVLPPKDGATASTGRQSAARRRSTGSSQRTAAPVATVDATPLQAIRHRRSVIQAEIKGAADALAAATKAQKAAEEAHAKVEKRHTAELANLETAEKALQGKAQSGRSRRAPARRTARTRAQGTSRRRAATSANGSGGAAATNAQTGGAAVAS